MDKKRVVILIEVVIIFLVACLPWVFDAVYENNMLTVYYIDKTYTLSDDYHLSSDYASSKYALLYGDVVPAETKIHVSYVYISGQVDADVTIDGIQYDISRDSLSVDLLIEKDDIQKLIQEKNGQRMFKMTKRILLSMCYGAVCSILFIFANHISLKTGFRCSARKKNLIAFAAIVIIVAIIYFLTPIYH